MTSAAPPTSARLLRAADVERAELDRHRERLERERHRLRDELARIEAGLADVDERQRLLDRLAPRAADQEIKPVAGASSGAAPAPADDATVLRGPAIRETAVRLLLEDPRGAEALHYREWFERLAEAGFAVAGKDPLAVFLTQLTRSPVLSKSTQAGVYELDRSAPARLRSRLAALHDDLRQLAATPGEPTGLAAIRARREELNSEIAQTEKRLEEADRLLGATRPRRELAAVG